MLSLSGGTKSKDSGTGGLGGYSHPTFSDLWTGRIGQPLCQLLAHKHAVTNTHIYLNTKADYNNSNPHKWKRL